MYMHALTDRTVGIRFNEDERLYAVHIRVEPRFASYLSSPHIEEGPWRKPLWRERPLLLKRADGTLEIIGQSRNLQDLACWVLRFGPHAQVCGPDVLRQKLASMLRNILRALGESP